MILRPPPGVHSFLLQRVRGHRIRSDHWLVEEVRDVFFGRWRFSADVEHQPVSVVARSNRIAESSGELLKNPGQIFISPGTGVQMDGTEVTPAQQGDLLTGRNGRELASPDVGIGCLHGPVAPAFSRVGDGCPKMVVVVDVADHSELGVAHGGQLQYTAFLGNRKIGIGCVLTTCLGNFCAFRDVVSVCLTKWQHRVNESQSENTQAYAEGCHWLSCNSSVSQNGGSPEQEK